MEKRSLGLYIAGVLFAALVVVSGASTAFATTSKSSNYSVTETEFNAGASLNSCSGNYCARTTLGEVSTGNASSATKSTTFGAIVPGEPSLDLIIETGVSDLGELSSTRTATKTMNVKIRSYLSDGYTLQIVGSAPKYGGYTISTPSSPTASVKGTEQFAINVAANTVPSVGANPVQVPDDTISFGEVTDNYKQANMFMYNSGDVVGLSQTQSGQTDYTISMIVNVSNTTPAGHYSADFAAVVTPVY